MRWCGTPSLSRRVGLAEPMSMPRYTRAESTEMISTGNRLANDSERAVLPQAVGPSSIRARGFVCITSPA